MRSAAKRKPERFQPAAPLARRPAPSRKPEKRVFHATVQVTRIEEWFVEAENEVQARALLEGGYGHRAQVGECTHFEIDKVSD
jgi:hypothetical protein